MQIYICTPSRIRTQGCSIWAVKNGIRIAVRDCGNRLCCNCGCTILKAERNFAKLLRIYDITTTTKITTKNMGNAVIARVGFHCTNPRRSRSGQCTQNICISKFKQVYGNTCCCAVIHVLKDLLASCHIYFQHVTMQISHVKPC
jgi:hypothetical protein